MVSLLNSRLCLLVPFLSYFLTLACGHPFNNHVFTRADKSVPLRILPLGDSITWGYQPGKGTNGYRAPLLSRLHNAGYKNVDYVGTQKSGNMSDPDNEGHPGYTITQIHNVMKGGLGFKPNVVLLHAGTNDLNGAEKANETWADAPKRLGNLLDDVLKVVPDAVVVVAKIIQAASQKTDDRIKKYNKAVPAVVESRVSKGFKVTIVDQSVVEANELVDGLHPTDAGYAHMGEIWFKGVECASEKGLIATPV